MIQILLEIGIMLLLIYPPLAIGGVEEISVTLIEVMSGALFLGWVFSLVFEGKLPVLQRKKRRRKQSAPSRLKKMNYRLRMTLPPALGAVIVLGVLACVQMLPWPNGFVKLLSPETFRLYAEAAANTASEVPSWLPLSVVTQATETELCKFIAYILLFIVIVNVIKTPAQIRRLLAVLLTMGAIEAIYGLSQITQSRISGTFVNHNHFAGYLEMLIPLAFGLLLAQLETRRSSAPNIVVRLTDDKYLKTALILVLIVLLTIALLLSGSRGGVISFSLGMIYLCVVAYNRRLFRKWVRVIFVCVLLMFSLAVIVRPEAILQRFGALAKPESELSFQYRLHVWENALEIVQDFPGFGAGLGAFSHLFARYQTFPSDLEFTHVENDYLQLLTETGILGIIIMLWAVAAYAYTTFAAWRRQRSRWPIAIGAGGMAALVSMAVHSSVDFNLHIPSNAIVFTVIAALTYCAVHLQKTGSTGLQEGAVNEGIDPQHPPTTRYIVAGTRTLDFEVTRLKAYGLVCLATLMIGAGIVWVGRTYGAALYYQQFRESVTLIGQGYISDDDVEATTLPAKQAIYDDVNHPDYYFILGSYLYQHALEDDRKGEVEASISMLQDAESWLQQAVIRDPANPWYYYELWRVHSSLGCPEGRERCIATRFLSAAFTNAPFDIFMRTQMAVWQYPYRPENAIQLVQRMLSKYPQYTQTALKGLWYHIQDPNTLQAFLPDTPEVLMELSRFLYDKQMDAASDRITNLAVSSESRYVELCSSSVERVHEGAGMELGNDDGTAEWRSYLADDSVRVKKVICLPQDVGLYKQAALKIFMNSGVPGEFVTLIHLDNHLIQSYHDTLSHEPQWYEIPFDPALLLGKSWVSVYIRVRDASAAGNYLQVMGDQHSPTTFSVFNFDTIDDLSFDSEIQTGEYMIRLVLQ